MALLYLTIELLAFCSRFYFLFFTFKFIYNIIYYKGLKVFCNKQFWSVCGEIDGKTET